MEFVLDMSVLASSASTVSECLSTSERMCAGQYLSRFSSVTGAGSGFDPPWPILLRKRKGIILKEREVSVEEGSVEDSVWENSVEES